LKNSDSTLNLTLRLLIITVCAGLILGLVYAITLEPIEYQTELKATQARTQVLAQAQDFEEIDMDTLSYDPEEYSIVQKIFKGTDASGTAGYTFEIVTKGYSAGLTLTVGINSEGSITGVAIGSHEETPGLGANATKPEFLGQYTGPGPFTVVKGGSASAESEADDVAGASTQAEAGAKDVQALTGATITSNAVTDAVNKVLAFYDAYLKEGV
jgi:electron transport complex protein RnfG